MSQNVTFASLCLAVILLVVFLSQNVCYTFIQHCTKYQTGKIELWPENDKKNSFFVRFQQCQHLIKLFCPCPYKKCFLFYFLLKKLFSFSRYSNFYNFTLPFIFFTFQIQKDKQKWNNLRSHELACINLQLLFLE